MLEAAKHFTSTSKADRSKWSSFSDFIYHADSYRQRCDNVFDRCTADRPSLSCRPRRVPRRWRFLICIDAASQSSLPPVCHPFFSRPYQANTHSLHSSSASIHLSPLSLFYCCQSQTPKIWGIASSSWSATHIPINSSYSTLSATIRPAK